MTEDQDAAKDSQSDSAAKSLANKSKDKKTRAQRPLTKIIIRRLPPTMSEEAFLEQVSPIPEHDHFYFAKPDLSLGNNVYSRAYINFVNIEDIYIFRDKFDGYVFLDEKGVEYVGIVEYAPFQRIPKKKKKKDPKCGTIESDPIYQEFHESLTRDPEPENQPKLEYSYPSITDASDKKSQTTPLLEYLAARKLDKRGRDERRRRENDKRKMRIERKCKDGTIKIHEDISEDEKEDSEHFEYRPNHEKFWSGEERVYHKSKLRHTRNSNKNDPQIAHDSDEFISTEPNWDNHFPALSAKMHNAFTLSSDRFCNKKNIHEASQQSGGDTVSKEDEIVENEVKKIKPRDWEKDKMPSKFKDEFKSDGKESTIFESKSYREKRISALNNIVDKKKKLDSDKKDDDPNDDGDKVKRDKKDKLKESPREQKSKKYSDTRKERTKLDAVKSDKPVASKPEVKLAKSMNDDDIKPFTQLPQVKTDDLTKLIEEMDRKVKMDELQADGKVFKEKNVADAKILSKKKDSVVKPDDNRLRRNSLDSGEASLKEECQLMRLNSLGDRSKSTDREDSEEKEKSEGNDRPERRIRNKDRPSLVIYQPGMGKFSKQRLAKEKDTPVAKLVNESEKKDT